VPPALLSAITPGHAGAGISASDHAGMSGSCIAEIQPEWLAQAQFTLTVHFRRHERGPTRRLVLPIWHVGCWTGCSAKLMNDPNKSYSNSTGAAYHLKRFRDAIARARVSKLRANTLGTGAWRFPQNSGPSASKVVCRRSVVRTRGRSKERDIKWRAQLHGDIYISDNATFQDAFQYNPPPGRHWTSLATVRDVGQSLARRRGGAGDLHLADPDRSTPARPTAAQYERDRYRDPDVTAGGGIRLRPGHAGHVVPAIRTGLQQGKIFVRHGVTET